MLNRKRAPALVFQNLKDLQKRLNSRNETEREQAFLEALALPAEALLYLMTPEVKRARVNAQTQEAVGTCGCLWVLMCIATVIAQSFCHTAFLLWDALLFLGLPVFIGVMRKTESRYQMHGLLVRALLTQNDARFVAPALLFYRYLDMRAHPGLYEDVRHKLLHLLPQVTPADVDAWTPVHKTTLRQQLVWHDLEMLEVALQTLARVGNAEDVSVVRRLACMIPEQIAAQIRPDVLANDRIAIKQAILADTTPNPKIHGTLDPENEAVMQDERYQQWCLNRAREIHALANHSLAMILERSGQRQQASGLLRASQATNGDATQNLLRPQIESVNPTPPEQLLRSNTSNT